MLNKIDALLNIHFNIDLKECKYFKGLKYVKIFKDEWVIYYNIDNDHLEKIYDINLHLINKGETNG